MMMEKCPKCKSSFTQKEFYPYPVFYGRFDKEKEDILCLPCVREIKNKAPIHTKQMGWRRAM
jgi:hypothetical protein